MKIVVENHIPYIHGILEPYADVVYLPSADITADAVADADAMLVRTRTRCDSALLEGSRCSFIGTATIGTDHIDLDYCRQKGITVANAPGCNAPAVAQYVHSVIANWLASKGLEADDCQRLTLGIIGVGHVGSIVERWARELGYKVILCDPPRARKENSQAFVPLDTLLHEADIITIHTPYTKSGIDRTHHLCDDDFVARLSHCRLLINSARGPITDTSALLRALETGKIGDVAIDCWEGEPDIDRALLAKAFIATPHIAGYSAEGKMRATAMTVDAISRHFGWNIKPEYPSAPRLGASGVTLARISGSYNPLLDTENLRNTPERFEELRNHYNLRAEVPELY